MIRKETYQKNDGSMKTKWIFRLDGDLTKDYSDFKTLETLCNRIYENPGASKEIFVEFETEVADERGEDL